MTANSALPRVSVVIPTHNPRMDYLARVIAALRQQALPREQWEIIVVDNGSRVPLTAGMRHTAYGIRPEDRGQRSEIGEQRSDARQADLKLTHLKHNTSELDLGWHPHARIVREEELGLTFARLRGFTEAKGELIVMVDDDNVLAPDYLEMAVRIAQEHPVLGAFGGKCLPEFEVKPDAWLEARGKGLGLRDRGDREELFPREHEADGIWHEAGNRRSEVGAERSETDWSQATAAQRDRRGARSNQRTEIGSRREEGGGLRDQEVKSRQLAVSSWQSEENRRLNPDDGKPSVANRQRRAVREFPDCAPIGAGMVLRREAAAAYAERIAQRAYGMRQTADGWRPEDGDRMSDVGSSPNYRTTEPSLRDSVSPAGAGRGQTPSHRAASVITDRRGDSLASGGDNDICLTVVEEGWQVGYLPQLQLTHLIPKGRMTLDYHKRMARGSMKSFILMLDQHGIRPWPAMPRWTLPLRVASDWWRVKPWRGPEQSLSFWGHVGMYEGRAALPRGGARQ